MENLNQFCFYFIFDNNIKYKIQNKKSKTNLHIYIIKCHHLI